MQIKVSNDTMIPLGNGKWIRADHVIGLDPITGDERGKGSRTRVLIDHASNELIAGRTEHTIIRDMREQVDEYTGMSNTPSDIKPYKELLNKISTSLSQIPDDMCSVMKSTGCCDIDELVEAISMIEMLGLGGYYPKPATDNEEDDLA